MRGGRYYNDPFRQRPQNTSRPPSMHVDDFVLVEEADHGPNKKPQRVSDDLEKLVRIN